MLLMGTHVTDQALGYAGARCWVYRYLILKFKTAN